MSWTLTKKLDASAGAGEIKRRVVVLDPQVSTEEIKNREVELGLKARLLSLQLFPNAGATDIVFATALHSSWDSNCVVRYLVAAQCRADTAITFCCSGGGPRSLGLPGWRLSRGLTILSPFPTRPRP